MAKYFSVKVAFCVFLLTITLQSAHSSRNLVEDTVDPPVVEDPAPAVAPVASNLVTTPVSEGTPVTSPSAVVGTGDSVSAQTPLTFFMHDIVGGSTPSTRMVTGIVANSGANGQLPFSKPNSGVFPVNAGVPLVNRNNINPNNIPFATGLGNNGNNFIQNNGNNNAVNSGNRLPFVSGNQLPSGSTLQKLMFGSITVVDDELTEGHELGSSVVGKIQGFYLASSQDGSSQTMALTALLHGSGGAGGSEADHEYDTINFFGIHRTAAHVSHIAIVGGTGKYEHAKGYSTIESLEKVDQHTTDGVETVLKITVYLTE